MPFSLMPRRAPGLPLACLLTFLMTAHAQPPLAAARPDPLDPHASVPPQGHASSLNAYRRLTDEPALAWREANDAVGRLGGWRAYAREAQRPDAEGPPAVATRPSSAADSATSPNRSSNPGGHHGHAVP